MCATVVENIEVGVKVQSNGSLLHLLRALNFITRTKAFLSTKRGPSLLGRLLRPRVCSGAFGVCACACVRILVAIAQLRSR